MPNYATEKLPATNIGPHKITCSSFITWPNHLNRIMGRINVNVTLRLAAYWSTVLAGLWSLTFFFAYGTEKGRDWYRNELADTVRLL